MATGAALPKPETAMYSQVNALGLQVIAFLDHRGACGQLILPRVLCETPAGKLIHRALASEPFLEE